MEQNSNSGWEGTGVRGLDRPVESPGSTLGAKMAEQRIKTEQLIGMEQNSNSGWEGTGVAGLDRPSSVVLTEPTMAAEDKTLKRIEDMNKRLNKKVQMARNRAGLVVDSSYVPGDEDIVNVYIPKDLNVGDTFNVELDNKLYSVTIESDWPKRSKVTFTMRPSKDGTKRYWIVQNFPDDIASEVSEEKLKGVGGSKRRRRKRTKRKLSKKRKSKKKKKKKKTKRRRTRRR